LLDSLKKLFKNNNKENEEPQLNEGLDLLCGIMIEAAETDGKIEQNEILKISNILINIFEEDSDEVKKTIDICLKDINQPKSLHYFTSKINKLFSEEKKILLIETLWEIVLSDGELHEYESNLIRRLCGLLYVSDINCGNAKKRALSKINL
tara:strand:- start:223 stop:675 length:453 start_codon:yes stop_codon:yes gene_type:complete